MWLAKATRYSIPAVAIMLAGMVSAEDLDLDFPILQPPMPGTNLIFCGAGQEIEGDIHWAVASWNSGGPGAGHGWHWGTRPGGLYEHHPRCGEGQAAAELTKQIIEAVNDEDVEKLARLAANRAVRLSHGRTAVQVVGCDGRVIAGHVPLNHEFFALTNTHVLASAGFPEADITSSRLGLPQDRE